MLRSCIISTKWLLNRGESTFIMHLEQSLTRFRQPEPSSVSDRP